ncbi:prepilin-type N-terminal cleavage/methylation domain-containing protein [Candidatus Gracilibacteria bacterium]|nr:prepilin-type N-terminal cleavage/methylation domain-containing protein [Candidatus Gracilibacteria bacterium]
MLLKISQKDKNAFTLIEIVIVLAIISILVVSSYVGYSFYVSKARDATRISDLTNISDTMDYLLLNGGSLAIPDGSSLEKVEMNGILWKQGIYGKESYSKSSKDLTYLPIDPLTKENYKYFLSEDGRFYKIEAILEDGQKYSKTNFTPSLIVKNKEITSKTTNISNNLPFVKSFTGDNTIYSEIKFLVTAELEDADGDEVTISSKNLPRGITINGKNISGSISEEGTYSFDLELNDGKDKNTINIPIYVSALPRTSQCYIGGGSIDPTGWLLFNSSNGQPDMNGDIAFYVKDYKNYRMNEIIGRINEKLNSGLYTPASFGGPTCYFDNNELFG